MYLNEPVRIPEIKGKITFKKYKDGKYVLYETGRRYDKWRKYDLVSRVNIGNQIPAMPEYMIPNENYFKYIAEGEREMKENEQDALEKSKRERERAFKIQEFFEQMYYDFQFRSKTQPDTVLNEFKVRKLNRVLEPLLELIKDEPAAAWLEVIPEPVEEETEDGKTVLRGMTYSDVMIILTQFRCVEGDYFQKMLLK